ncbi:acyltransferase family protein [Scytonema sp. UIC 10036]|uniref:acyltransferase family protein n=1 Tax=Scytonema sp. UIC 10036 TaxID=2304196 RepID=UPI0012DA1C88|nr:acyltransferase [Scytonema sp. UIC 10036]MUH01188.1 acyltransferase family protein [Scytonema sp. UIC 10036]
MIKPKVHFYFVDALRGIAALWVVLSHAALDGRIAALTGSLPQWFATFVFDWGTLGVAIFFVLSGFVIAHSLREAKVDLLYTGYFSLRRLARLNPPYYVSILVVLGFGFLSSHLKGVPFEPMDQPLSFQRLLAHLFYLQELLGFKNINDVYWTLSLEIQFYLVFCGLLWLTQWLSSSRNIRFSRALVFVPSAILAALFPLGVFEDLGRPIIFLPLWYGFLLGVFSYWSWYGQLNPVFFYLYSGFLVTTATATASKFAIACVITAIILLEVGRANRMHWLKWQGLQFLGRVSYSVYLTHTPILGAVFFIGYKLLNRSVLSEAFCLFLGIIACVGFATIMWYIVEKPSIALSQQIKPAQKLEKPTPV